MKKIFIKIILGTTLFAISPTITSLAGSWQTVNNDWKYQNDDGSYVMDAWLSDNNSNYYFDSSGIMLKNTLSPDGFPLGRDGKRLSADEALPLVFPGTEADYDAYTNAMTDYFYGYHKQFTDEYASIHVIVLDVYSNQNYQNARNAINSLDTFNFAPYMLSDFIGIRKITTLDEIFRIESKYYMSELVQASEQQDSAYRQEILNKMDLSADKYFSGINSLIDRSILWGDDFN